MRFLIIRDIEYSGPDDYTEENFVLDTDSEIVQRHTQYPRAQVDK